MKQKIKLEVLFLVSAMLIPALLIFPEIPTAKADSVTDAITAGLDWLDRMAYREVNSTHAVATDSPMLAFRCYRSDGYWTIFGKETETNLPSSATMIRGGTTDPQGTTDDLNLITGEVNNQRSYFYWDMDGDHEYDDMTLYVEYAAMDADDTRLAVKVVHYVDVGITYNLQIETTTLINQVSLNAQASIDKQWGWQGARYTIRPTTKGLADLYVWLGTTQYSWLGGQTYQQVRGINYLDRALKLYRTWYGSGYILDRFDGHYGVTPQVRPWAGQYGIPNYPRNPDLIKEPYLGAYPDGSNYYMPGATATDNWYDYSNRPNPFTYGLQNGVLRFTTVSRHIMPDEEWDKTPFWCSNDQFAFNYRSRTSFSWARNTYIANGLDFDIKNYNGNPIPILGLDVVLGVGTDAKSIRASHDMYKYGANVPYGLSTLKSEFLDTATWDGNGIAFDSWGGMKIGWEYPAYGTHNTATYGNALTQYYKLTNDGSVGTRADQVIGVLLMLQNKYDTPTYSRARDTYYYRPEFVGSFMPGYAVGYSFGQQDIYGAVWTDLIYGTLSTLNIFQEDVYPLAYPVMGNVECTIPSVWTLIEYKTTGRTPSNPTAPNYNLPFLSNGVAYTDHGGSNGGDGISAFIGSDLITTHISGNKYRVEGTLSKMQLSAWGNNIVGSGWSSIEYEWSMTLNNPATNWRAKAYFTTPNYMAYGTNTFQMQVTLYQGQTQIATQTEVLTTNEQTSGASGTSGKMWVFTDLLHQNYLASGTYTVKLKFIVQANGASGYEYIGRTCNNGVLDSRWATGNGVNLKGLAMGLEHFGYDMEEAQNAPYYNTLDVLSSTGGTCNMSTGIHGFLYNQKIILQATPNTGYQFSHWEKDGQLGGGQNPIIITMDTPHTIKPIFEQQTRYLAMGYPSGSGWGSISHSSGNYPFGTELNILATAYSGYQFSHWIFDGQTDYRNPLPVTMTANHQVMAYYNAYLNIPHGSECTTTLESGYYPLGSTQYVTATPTTGYAWGYWKKDDVWYTQSASTSILMDAPHTLTPNAHPEFHWVYLSVYPSESGYSNLQIGANEYTYFQTAYIYAYDYSQNGYTFDHWEVNGINVGAAQPLQLAMTTDYSVVAVYRTYPYIIVNGGQPSGYGYSNHQGFNTGTGYLTVTAYANSGYQFDYWVQEGYGIISYDATANIPYDGWRIIYPHFSEIIQPCTIYVTSYIDEYPYYDIYTVPGNTYQSFYPPAGTLYNYYIDGQAWGQTENVWCPAGGSHTIEWYVTTWW